ncbi:MAG: VPLPA-CTERM sorting domain-containing protein [Pseudomonadota bacterium]|nr:VPLPA-CTERM sorting domain-containing protein [Pseudomonadota bacterium]
MTFAMRAAAAAVAALVLAQPAAATLVEVNPCSATCTITSTPPNPVSPDPNDGVLLLWNERQNVTLTAPLAVDRVFDTGASFVSGSSGNFMLAAGTVVSSHYVQWDPSGASGSIQATITADSQIFAFITADVKLFNSDDILGLPGVDYNDFTNRGLESGDSTSFSGQSVAIDWTATSPGDWTRLITAYSPSADVPVPAALPLLAAALGAFGLAARRRQAL